MPKLTAEQVQQLTEIAVGFARNGESGELFDLIDHGLPVNVQDAGGNTPLMMAAYHGHAETVRGLIEREADVDLRNARDQSPIAGALFKGEDDVVRMLLAAGADLDAGTPTARLAAEMFGKTALLESEG
ncbi:ankyrin repeat domain-containing protein [Paramicrobacterium sp. CJ85]|uniref:ankyrin repeat domain-containing protein n=1 Tax=Paramicrobacterium sp. CJ85 TaxID=3445355 RepID=UPI003F612C12